MVGSLVSNGVWAKLDVFYCFAQEVNTGGEALKNWITPASYACVNSGCTFTSLEGFTGNGSSWYLYAPWVASTNAVHMTLNAGSIGAYSRLNRAAEDDCLVGVVTAGSYFGLSPRISGDLFSLGINDAWSVQTGITNTLSYGLFVGTRSSSTVLNGYVNGSSIGTDTATSTSLTSGNIEFLGCAAMASYYSANEISFGFAGGLLTATDVSNLNTAIETYMDSNGKGVEP
jgi:hypothetical protein